MRRRVTVQLNYWSLVWSKFNRLDGRTEHLCLFDHREPDQFKLFKTRREALAYCKERYGYIARRGDLRTEPHCWRVPKAVKVSVTIQEKEYRIVRDPSGSARAERIRNRREARRAVR